MGTFQYDVVIAGAGPAGSAAAIALKQAGINVCLVDRKTVENRKVGESIPGASIRLLGKLGINGIGGLLNAGDYKQCLVNASSWGSEQWIYQSGMANPEGGGFHLNRTAFDEALRQKALNLGIPIYPAMIDQLYPIEDSKKNTSGFAIQLKHQDLSESDTISTQWLVDATGRKAVIGRKFGLKRERIDDQMAAVCWVKAAENDIDYATRIKSVPDGWWYTSLLPDHTRVISFQGLPATVAQLHKDHDLFFKKFNDALLLPYKVAPNSSVQSNAVDAGVIKPLAVTAPGVICVGDAALSFDPLSSQGIFFALYSGIKGAETIAKCLSDPASENNIRSEYQAVVEKVFLQNQKSRAYFYRTEMRYTKEPYWQSRSF